jgi:hypothetical protein
MDTLNWKQLEFREGLGPLRSLLTASGLSTEKSIMDCVRTLIADRDRWQKRAEAADRSFRGVSEQVSVSGPWACFHCGFITGNEADAKAHFGDRDDEEPLCLTWHDLDSDGRVSEYQSMSRELNAKREENDALRTKVEGLEYRVDSQLAEIHSFVPFRRCNSINEVFHTYDSMEGEALAALERATKAEAQRDEAVKRAEAAEHNANKATHAQDALVEGLTVQRDAAQEALSGRTI